MTRRRVEINNDHSIYIFCVIIPLCNFPYRNSVRSITLIPLEIISQNFVEIYSMTRQHAEIKNGHTTYSFCRIILFCNFPYRNCVRSITLNFSKVLKSLLIHCLVRECLLIRQICPLYTTKDIVIKHTAKQLYFNVLQTFSRCKSTENKMIKCYSKLI